jgi:hypothetical protein
MATSQPSDELGEFPEAWRWNEHGAVVSGTFVKFDRGQTKDYGPKVIVVLDVDGEQRSIWLTATVLFGKFKDELGNRPEHCLEPGERITIKRLDKVETKDAVAPYWKFNVIFHDSPELTTEDLFGEFDAKASEPPEEKPKPRAKTKKQELEDTDLVDDDIAF